MNIAMISGSIRQSLSGLRQKNVPSVRTLRRTWSARLHTAPGRTVIGAARALATMGDWERFVAYELIAHHESARQALRPSDITSLGLGMQSWGEVDCFACYVAGPAWRRRTISDGIVKQWARSSDRWWRRAALVSTVPLNNRARGGTGDTARTLTIARMLVHDRDDMVVKALSWALRELSKRDRRAVERFMQQHTRSLAARVIREVNTKLTTGVKSPRRVKP